MACPTLTPHRRAAWNDDAPPLASAPFVSPTASWSAKVTPDLASRPDSDRPACRGGAGRRRAHTCGRRQHRCQVQLRVLLGPHADGERILGAARGRRGRPSRRRRRPRDASALPGAAPVAGITPTTSGRGHWLTASDGGVLTYGDAPFYGSAVSLRAPVGLWRTGMPAQPSPPRLSMSDGRLADRRHRRIPEWRTAGAGSGTGTHRSGLGAAGWGAGTGSPVEGAGGDGLAGRRQTGPAVRTCPAPPMLPGRALTKGAGGVGIAAG